MTAFGQKRTFRFQATVRPKGEVPMKGIVLILATALLPVSAFAGFLGQERDWGFIQSVGGISISEPREVNGKWELPIQCDVSGLIEVTTKPSMLNSGLICATTKAQISDNEISLTVETDMVGAKDKSPICKSAKLGKIKKGTYRVFYLSPNNQKNELGLINIE